MSFDGYKLAFKFDLIKDVQTRVGGFSFWITDIRIKCLNLCYVHLSKVRRKKKRFLLIYRYSDYIY